MIYRSVAALALCLALSGIALSQYSYPKLEYQQLEGIRLWRIVPDYPNPNPPPVQIRVNDSTILEYTVLNGYQTNFRSGPKLLDLIAKQLDPTNNTLNLAWLIHDINYEGYLKDRDAADLLLYSMLLQANLHWVRAEAVYRGVKYLGKSHYCKENTSSPPCASNPLIRFRRRTVTSKSLPSALVLPTFELQTLRLKSKSEEDNYKVRSEIRKLFPDDADAIIKEFDQEQPRKGEHK